MTMIPSSRLPAAETLGVEPTPTPRLAAVLPVSPGTEPAFVADTLDAIAHYSSAPVRVILVDASGTGVGNSAARGREVLIVSAPDDDWDAGRYQLLSRGFARALEEHFDLLLRLDADATVIGPGWARAAWEQASADSSLGVLGNHLLGYDATPRNSRAARAAFERALSWRSLASAPGQRRFLSRLLGEAEAHGYQRGEHVAGGICVYSHGVLAALRDADLLGRPELAHAGLAEDTVFGLLARSQGFVLRQFGTRFDHLPCAVRETGLPDSPETLLASGKSLVCSTRYSGARHEGEVRAVFAACRREEERERRSWLDLRTDTGSDRVG